MLFADHHERWGVLGCSYILTVASHEEALQELRAEVSIMECVSPTTLDCHTTQATDTGTSMDSVRGIVSALRVLNLVVPPTNLGLVITCICYRGWWCVGGPYVWPHV